MEPLIGGPTSPFRSANTSAASSLPLDSQQPRELSDFSFYKAVNTADKTLHSTYRRGKRSAETSKLKSLQSQDSFKRDALRTITRFLSFSEFPGPLSAKALSSPQRSLLIEIWGHLFRRCFDDSVKITAENVNDEVPRLFKEIGYPFPISKSAMLAPGTGHQWPHHLAALSWLCELLIYENEFFFQEEETSECSGPADVVGKLVAAAYPQLGKDPQALRTAVLGQLQAMKRDAETAQQQMQQQLQQQQQQLAGIETELRDNASLMDTIEQLRREADSLRRQIAETRSEISNEESVAAATEAERDSLLQQQKAALKEVKRLEERVKAQGIDKAEVERIRHDVARLRDGVSHRAKEIEVLSEGLQDLVDKIADDSEKLRIAGQSVNDALSNMAQLAVSGKLQTAEAWSALPKMETVPAAAAAAGGAAAAAAGSGGSAAAERAVAAVAAAAACDVKRATKEILGVDWTELKKEMLRVMRLEEEAKEETQQQRQRLGKEIEKLKKAIKDLLASRKTLEKRMQLVQEDLQQLQQQQQNEQQQLQEAEREHLEGVREAKQQHQQQQQLLQRLVQQQEQLLQQEERQQQQQAAAAVQDLQQQQQQALQQKHLLLQQLKCLAETKQAEYTALEQQLLELSEALGPSPNQEEPPQ
ncbi:HEC/Ndc80p family protein, putative [Eimeria tenella]|uniref:Kinetochore protein NDC80 n=1 Tax=Eimeria tenella TaxID=5802 RepID=U6KIM6_EIMTE|nr:HEC/Ndc80p family protein, putative [Eimeria tenella]CDJ37845.1 HEC/Ndc80p family protein, putative [Eimeria tenella]|eukprot:XP_013228683.1 HEC/Ndc80p family protein, putative [Eimeria tenella]